MIHGRVILAEAQDAGERRPAALGTALRYDPNVDMAEVVFEDGETWWVKRLELRVLGEPGRRAPTCAELRELSQADTLDL